MRLRITTLSENITTASKFLAEHGLSILVEADGINILLDTGAGISASHNAGILGVDLRKIDKIVLSHGHSDHTGGLREVLKRIRKEVEVLAHPHIWAAMYSRGKDKKYRYVGVPFRRMELENLGAKFVLSSKPIKITDNIITTDEVPMVTNFEALEPDRYFTKEKNGWQPFEIIDDRALIIKTKQGLIVVLGCAHRGIINTLYHARQLTGVERIHMVLGGCHLINSDKERVMRTVSTLKKLDVQKIGVSHCTGLSAIAIMAQELGDKFFFNNTGNIINLP